MQIQTGRGMAGKLLCPRSVLRRLQVPNLLWRALPVTPGQQSAQQLPLLLRLGSCLPRQPHASTLCSTSETSQEWFLLVWGRKVWSCWQSFHIEYNKIHIKCFLKKKFYKEEKKCTMKTVLRSPEIPPFCLYLHRQKKRHSRKKLSKKNQLCPKARAVHYLKCKNPMHFVITRTCLEMGIRQHHRLWLYKLTW